MMALLRQVVNPGNSEGRAMGRHVHPPLSRNGNSFPRYDEGRRSAQVFLEMHMVLWPPRSTLDL